MPERSPLEQAVSDTGFFFTMLTITAKYAMGASDVETLDFFKWPIIPLRSAVVFAGIPCPFDPDNIPAHPKPMQKIELLRDLGKFSESIMPIIEAQGSDVQWTYLPHAYRFFDLAEVIVK